ncbi:MAG: hypothetical protein ACKOFE_05960, partial [Bacteroidota bacterium]
MPSRYSYPVFTPTRLLHWNILFGLFLVFPWGLPLTEASAEILYAPQGSLWLDSNKLCRIYRFELQDQVAPPFWRKVQLAFAEAQEQEADLVLIRLNTYGGQVDLADSVRTRLLRSKIPVVVWV